MGDCCSHPALEPLPLSEGQCVCLGDDRNHVDLIVNGLHKLNIQGFQAGWTGNEAGMGSKRDKEIQVFMTQLALTEKRLYMCARMYCRTHPWPSGEMK